MKYKLSYMLHKIPYLYKISHISDILYFKIFIYILLNSTYKISYIPYKISDLL